MRRRPNEDAKWRGRLTLCFLCNLSHRVFNDVRATRVRSKGRNENKTASVPSVQMQEEEKTIYRERETSFRASTSETLPFCTPPSHRFKRT